MALPRLLVLALAPVLAVSACSGSGARPSAGLEHTSSAPASPARVGGPSVDPVAVPTAPMDGVEKPVAARLRHKAAAEGLTLDYLACPHWDGAMPEHMACTGFFNGVRARVEVRLTGLPRGSVGFDARIAGGLVATSRLEARLREHGYHAPDCGARPAYPSRPGLSIRCAGLHDGHRAYVVATVTDRSGDVTIRPG